MFAWLWGFVPRSPRAARRLIVAGRVPRRLWVRGRLELAGSPLVRTLTARLVAEALDVSDCVNLGRLPERLRCCDLFVRRTNIAALPRDLRVTGRVDASGCRRLRGVPVLRVASLVLAGCGALGELPDGTMAATLDLGGCYRLKALPRSAAMAAHQLVLRDCAGLSELPDRFGVLEWLDVSGCAGLAELPEGLRVRSWVDVAGSGLTRLPWSLRSTRVLWRGVQVSDRVAFEPASITVEEILAEQNQTMRRTLLDRVGMDWFLDRAGAEVLDADRDPGGPRRLLRVPAGEGEDIVCVEVRCPSTGHRYCLRVPPQMMTCRQAIAWTAGYANPKLYQPVVET